MESETQPQILKDRRQLLGPVLLAVFTVMMGLGIIAPLIPGYARTLGANGFLLGAIFSVFSISRTALTPITGILSDRWGRRYFMLSGLVFYCLVSIAYIQVESVSGLLIVRALHGMAAALVIPAANAYVADLAPKKKEGTYMGFFLVSFLSGFAIGPAIGGLFYDRFGMAWCFLTLGILALCSFFCTFFWVPNLKVTPSANPGKSRQGSLQLLKSQLVVALLVFTLVSAVGRGSIVCFLPLLAMEKLGMSASLLGVVITTNLLLAALLQLPFGILADRVNRKTLLLAGTLLSGAMFAVMPYARGFSSLLLINILMGIGVALFFPASQALAVSLARGKGMGAMLSFLQTATGVGFAAGPLISGIIYKNWGVDPVFYVCAGFLAVAAVYGFFFLRVFPLNPADNRVKF